MESDSPSTKVVREVHNSISRLLDMVAVGGPIGGAELVEIHEVVREARKKLEASAPDTAELQHDVTVALLRALEGIQEAVVAFARVDIDNPMVNRLGAMAGQLLIILVAWTGVTLDVPGAEADEQSGPRH
jgi:hypothetical protein